MHDIQIPRTSLIASLLFAPNERPTAAAVASLAGEGAGFTSSPNPDAGGVDRDGWAELLVNGLAFDVQGLTPGRPASAPAHGHRYGLPADLPFGTLEAVALRPGPHLSGGTTVLAVVRALAGLAASFTELPGVLAVAWHPARCCCAPEPFRDSVRRWLAGGAFPAFSLAALAAARDGGVQSEGLALFVGQELRLEPELALDAERGARIAVRLLHRLAEKGPVTAIERVIAPDGTLVRLEPSANGRFVRAWKG